MKRKRWKIYRMFLEDNEATMVGDGFNPKPGTYIIIDADDWEEMMDDLRRAREAFTEGMNRLGWVDK